MKKRIRKKQLKKKIKKRKQLILNDPNWILQTIDYLNLQHLENDLKQCN